MKELIPETLYRGVVVNERIIKTKHVLGVDLTPPNQPSYDAQGRKTVGDGNEYGLYMTDNEEMAARAYAGVELSDGTPLNKTIDITTRRLRVSIPSVGILYKISTKNLDVRRPWITKSLEGLYNNGFEGDEWITDRIPLSNYEVEHVYVGEDILHPKKEITFNNQEEILNKIFKELDERRKKLEEFEKILETIPERERLRMSEDTLNIYREIYKKDGLKDTNINTYEVNNVYDCIHLIMTKIYKEQPDKIPMSELEYLMRFKKNDNLSFTEMNKVLLYDLKNCVNKKQEYIDNRKHNNEEVNTISFDNRIKMISKIIELYHNIILKEAIELTGVQLDSNIDTILDLRINEGIINRRLEDIHYSEDLSRDLYLAMKKEVREEVRKIIESNSFKTNETGKTK